MAKLPDLKHVKYVWPHGKGSGKVYAYFNTGKRKANGQVLYVRLPDPASPGFYPSYGAFVAGRTKRAAVVYTIKQMADEFEASPEFAAKAKGTRQLYTIMLRQIVRELGKAPVNGITREDVRIPLEAMRQTPGAYNMFRAVLGALYAWGREMEKTELEPVKSIRKMAVGEHEPWPEEILEAGLVSTNDRIRLVVHLLYFTGQRIGDVLKIKWTDIRKGFLVIVPQKTSKHRKVLRVKLHQELVAELAKTPRKGLTIVTTQDGTPASDSLIRRDLKEFTAALGHETVPHGLRKNAVNALLEAGCSAAEVSSFTGQTMAIIEHYAARMNVQTLSESAVLKFETKGRNSA